MLRAFRRGSDAAYDGQMRKWDAVRNDGFLLYWSESKYVLHNYLFKHRIFCNFLVFCKMALGLGLGRRGRRGRVKAQVETRVSQHKGETRLSRRTMLPVSDPQGAGGHIPREKLYI
jgi:hypothetical protein